MLDYVWKKLTSIKLAIYLFIIIAGFSIIGTVLVQGKPHEEYIRLFGTVGYRIMATIGLFDVYHSFWFRFLLALLSINLTLCSIDRIPSLVRSLTSPTFLLNKNKFSTLPFNRELKIKNVEVEKIKNILSKEGYTIKEKNDDRVFAVEGRKGTLARWGPYITHIGILCIIVGAYIGSLFGFRAFVNVVEGESINMVYDRSKKVPIPLGFQVKCTDFSIVYYKGSTVPKDYYSSLEIYEDGILKAKKRIEVNAPLTYKGLRFYQASYGIAAVKEVVFILKLNGEEQEISLKPHKEKRINDTLILVLEEFREDFKGFGPTAIVRAVEDRKTKRFPVFKNIREPQFHPSIEGGTLVLKNAEFLYYTGLEVTKDPGINVVWLGCIIATIGMIIAFYIPYRRIFITLFKNEGIILIGGLRMHGRDYSYVEKIYNKLEKEV